MKVIALDHETPLVRPAYQAPPLVCGQWCEISSQGRVGAGHVELPHVYLPRLVEWLREPETLIVGAETSYEILTSCTTMDLWRSSPVLAASARAWPDMPEALGLDPACPGTALLELWASALDADRVTDIFVRQKLLDLARGCYRYERHIDGTVTGVHKYNLAALARRLAGIDIPEENKKCRVCDNTGCPHCPWRLRYVELAGVPVDQWPREAYEYAALDPVATGAVWVAQWRRSTKIEANFPGVTAADVLREEYDEMRAALPLKAMSAYGLRTEPGAVARFEAHVREQYAAVADSLVGAKLLRRAWKRDREALKAWIQKQGLADAFVTTDPETGIPNWSLARACFDVARTRATPDQARVLANVYAENNTDPELLSLGLSYVDESRDTKAAFALITWAHGGLVPKELMTAGGKPPKAGAPVPAKPKAPSAPVPKTDKDSLLIVVDVLESAVGSGSAADPDQCAWAADVLRDYAELSHLSKQLGTDIPILRDGAVRPIHTRFETMLETQRTSSSKPNVQNQARGGKVKCRACKGGGELVVPATGERVPCDKCDGLGERDLPGTRECFVPRKGWVLIDADYTMLEIYALAQTCLWELGFSAFAEALKAGQDVHLVVAAQICGMSYPDAKAAFKDKAHARHAEVKNARNAGKAVNFGRPGGLSAKTMRSYAVKSYGVSKTVAEWQEIIDVWNSTWSEMPAYFAKVNTQESYPRSGLFNVRYASPDGFRALARYCAACNSKYQRLGAKTGKRALWYLFKACYTRFAEGAFEPLWNQERTQIVGRVPVLFGCRPNNWIHDQAMVEAPEDRAHVAAVAVGALMNKAGRELMPDCPVTTEPILCRRWSKNAAEVRDESGRLVPWEDIRLT